MKRVLLILVSLVVILSQNAPAQTDSTHSQKSTGTAVALSAAATVLPLGAAYGFLQLHAQKNETTDFFLFAGLGMLGGGLIFGPTAGHVYANRAKPLKGALVRTAACGICASGLIVVASAGIFNPDKSRLDMGIAVMGVGGALILGSATYDITTLGKSVDDFNRRHGCSNVNIVPTYFPDNGAIGLTASLTIGL